MCRLEEQVAELKSCGINMLHIDVIDGYFSPSMPLGLETVRQLRARTDLFFDCHVMAKHPEYFINELLEIGVQHISFHAETCTHIDAMLNKIHSGGAKAGIALKPATSLSVLDYILEKCDSVLVMLINPGFAFCKCETQINYVERKIMDLKEIMHKHGLKQKIIADGRVSPQNIKKYGRDIIDIFVCGTTCIKRTAIKESALKLFDLRNSLLHGRLQNV
jgi:ribulose-phosphate 3-epimerase